MREEISRDGRRRLDSLAKSLSCCNAASKGIRGECSQVYTVGVKMPKGKSLPTESANEEWTPELCDLLLEMYLDKAPIRTIQKRLGRTEDSIYSKLDKLATRYRKTFYIPFNRTDRTGKEINKRDQDIIARVRRHSKGVGVDVRHLSDLLARSKEEVEDMIGLRKKEKGFGLV